MMCGVLVWELADSDYPESDLGRNDSSKAKNVISIGGKKLEKVREGVDLSRI